MALEVIKRKTGSGKEFNETRTNEKCYRLVHDGKKVVDFFESEGFTTTGHILFLGTKKECEDEMKKLGLKEVEATTAERDR